MVAETFQEEMTPRERFNAVLDGRPFDRLPINLLLGDHASRVIGIRTSDYYRDPAKMIEAQVAAQKTYGHDLILASSSLLKDLGVKTVVPEDGLPYVVDNLIDDESDLERLEPPDSHQRRRFINNLEALIDALGPDIPVVVTIGGTLSTAAKLRGTANLLRDLYHNPELVHKILHFVVASIIPYINQACHLGVYFAVFDPVSSGSLISPKQYREYAFPYQQEIIAHIKRVGARSMLNICGNTSKIWNEMADTGADWLSLDNTVDLDAAKHTVGGRVILDGNIRPADTMFLGTPADAEANVKECLRKAYDNPGGFILGLGCGMPTNTPPANIHALVAAARKYGRYPLDPEFFS